MKRLFVLSAVCGLLSSCVKPAVQDIFIKSVDAAEGVYLFDFDLSDSLSVYDMYLYSRTDVAPRAFKRVPSINMTVEWFAPDVADAVAGEDVQGVARPGVSEQTDTLAGNDSVNDILPQGDVPVLIDTVALAAVQHGTVRQQYRTGVNPSVRGRWRLRVSVLNAPEHFCGLGIICERKDGTR